MALDDYKKKRDFTRTPEPPGEGRPPGGNSYCIQKHAASRLHYDFRLEHDGVLLSWAVPKGPSFDPREKRLAMHVEDHPVEYRTFEGVIPGGEYGAGPVVLWDQGTWTSLADPRLSLKRGELKFHLQAARSCEASGRWSGSRGDDPKAWLLIKEKDEHVKSAGEPGDRVPAAPRASSAGAASPRWRRSEIASGTRSRSGPGGEVDPGGPAESEGGARLRLAELAGAARGPLARTQPLALAMVVDAPPAGDEWFHEIKHDGYRIVARVEEGELQLISRNGQGLDEGVPPGSPGGGAACRPERCSSTGRSPPCCPMGRRASRRSSAVPTGRPPSSTSSSTCCTSDGWDLRQVGLSERKAVLRRLLEGAPVALRFSDHVRGQGTEFFQKARQAGLEGVISKRADAPYREGRGGDWCKAKCRLSQEVVIGGWRRLSDGRTAVRVASRGVP